MRSPFKDDISKSQTTLNKAPSSKFKVKRNSVRFVNQSTKNLNRVDSLEKVESIKISDKEPEKLPSD